MRDNPHLAPGTPLGDDYRSRLEQMDYRPPRRVNPVLGGVGLLMLMVALIIALAGGAMILFAIPTADWHQGMVGAAVWGGGVALGLAGYLIGRLGR